MPETAVDTNVLLDVLLDDPKQAAQSARALEEAARQGALVIGPATLAELATVFSRRSPQAGNALRAFLGESGIRATPLTDDDAVAAGKAFAAHLAKRARKAGIECQACGKTATSCPACGKPWRQRDRIATDFLILAHARSAGRLLTRDKGLKMQGVEIIRP